MWSRHEQVPRVIGVGPQWATANVRQKATVGYDDCEVEGYSLLWLEDNHE